MKSLCIFDLDGTLLDTVTSLWYCGNRALNDCGYPGLPKELYKIMVGNGAAVLIQRCIENVQGNEADFEKVFTAYCEYFKNDCMYEVKPYEGIPELIQSLKAKGFQLAVLSNKPHTQTVEMVNHFFSEGTFDMILGERKGIAKKPAPDGVFEILKELHKTSEDVLYFGDTNTDMQTAVNAKADSFGVLWGFRDRTELEENGAKYIIEHPLKALEYLK